LTIHACALIEFQGYAKSMRIHAPLLHMLAIFLCRMWAGIALLTHINIMKIFFIIIVPVHDHYNCYDYYLSLTATKLTKCAKMK